MGTSTWAAAPNVSRKSDILRLFGVATRLLVHYEAVYTSRFSYIDPPFLPTMHLNFSQLGRPVSAVSLWIPTTRWCNRADPAKIALWEAA